MRTLPPTHPAAVGPGRSAPAGGSLRDMRFSGRGYYDSARSPSVFTMRHDAGSLQFRIERPTGKPPVVRVHSEELHHEFPGLSAKLPALTREEIFQLEGALADSTPSGPTQKAELTALKRALNGVLSDTDRPRNTKPKTPRALAKLRASVDAAWATAPSPGRPTWPFPGSANQSRSSKESEA